MRILPLLLLAFSFLAMAAPPQTITIQTNAQCGMCKSTIEQSLLALDGVKEATLDLETKAVTVKFKGKKVSADDLRAAISQSGYQADSVVPDAAAQAKLSACCQPKKAKAGGCCAPKAGSSCGKKTGTK
ncbi:MAG: heavy metal-associated domain-containing protein [Bacteroidota bacterium]